MNTTKLCVVAIALRDEMMRTQTVSNIQQVVQVLQKLINQPNQKHLQEQLSRHLNVLYYKLKTSPINEFSPAWRDAVDELGVGDEFGSRLERRIKDIFEKNQITPQSALEEIQVIHQKVSETEKNLDGLVNGLEYFGVGEDTLREDECEVGIIVPRSYVDDNLKSFGAELVELEKFLLVFSELATGKREPVRIRQISSSKLSVFLEYIPEIGACIAIAVERIVALYKQLLDIRKLKQDLTPQEIPEEKLQGIDEIEELVVASKLEKIADELMQKYGDHLDPSRKNEVSIEIKRSLNKLANRIDRGFNIELRVAPKTGQGDEDNTGEAEKDSRVAAINQILESASKIDYLEHAGEPLLFLPESDDEEREGEKKKEKKSNYQTP